MSKKDHIIGLDLGFSADYSAAVVLERTTRPTWEGDSGQLISHYAARHIHRWSLKTPYDTIVDDVVKLVVRPPLDHPVLAVDITGVGRAVLDVLRRAKPTASIAPVLITGGHQTSVEDGDYHVPKKELVSTLQVLLQGHRLRVASLPEREKLLKELLAFKVKITASANESFESWRERDHDDLVLATAMAAWIGEKSRKLPLLRTIPLGPAVKQKLRIMACTRAQLDALEIEDRSLVIGVYDPTSEDLPRPRVFDKTLDSISLGFADLDPRDHGPTWENLIPPYGKTAAEIALQLYQSKQLWSFVLRRRDLAPLVLVIAGDGDTDRRPISLAMAICDGLGLSREITVYEFGKDTKITKDIAPPNRHVYQTARQGRFMVI